MDIDFKKMGGLVPAIIQDSKTLKVLMLGFMNEEALKTTESTGKSSPVGISLPAQAAIMRLGADAH